MNLLKPARLCQPAVAALAVLAALLPGAAQADPHNTHWRLEPGVHVFDTPQVFGPDSVLELVLSGGLGCGPCHTVIVFQNTVHFDGTLKLTMDDKFITWGGHWISLFSYRGIPDVPYTALPSGRFHTLDLPALDPSQGWGTDSLYANGTVLLAQLVPEPSALALWLTGGALLGGVALRRRPGANAAIRTRSG